jgi:hypothetical protein
VLFLLVSLGGAALWRVPAVRTALSASRPSGDPAPPHGDPGRTPRDPALTPGGPVAPRGDPGRTSGDPARWAGYRAGVGAIVGIAGSSLLAGIGGVGYTLAIRSSVPGANDALLWAALAAVLLGGVSVFGRRAGFAGTVLGVLIVQIVQTIANILGLSVMWTSMVVGVLIIVGLGVSRALESIGAKLSGGRARPAPPPRTT